MAATGGHETLATWVYVLAADRAPPRTGLDRRRLRIISTLVQFETADTEPAEPADA